MSDDKKDHRGLETEVTEKVRQQGAVVFVRGVGGVFARCMPLFNDLWVGRDQSLYQEVGRLTRTLHEAIRNFQIDPRSQEQKEVLSVMTDASDRLAYVVQMTGQAANRTMDLVEESMPIAHAVRDEASSLREEWQRLGRREMQPAEFRELYGRIDAFFLSVTKDADTIYNSLSEILLAQDFQDLTGQVIQRVTALVKEVEEQMLSLVVMASHVDQLTGTVHQLEGQEVSAELGVGPQINAEEREDVVSGQNDVDDLLSSLGF